jgi:hypothetical protein
MLRALAAVAILLAVAATPSPAPPAAPESSPSAAPPNGAIPEIGRTRATSPACTALREVVVPAFAAARRADARFEDTRKRLVRYGNFASGNDTRIGNRKVDAGTAQREGELAHLDTDASALLQASLQIRKLLEDPRLAKDAKDPLVQAERAQLDRLLAQQQTRANLLSEFVQRESMSAGINRVGMGSDAGISAGGLYPRSPDPAPQAHEPPPTAPPGMPWLTGDDFADRSRLSEWGDRAALAVRATENQAAKTFLTVAQSCR